MHLVPAEDGRIKAAVHPVIAAALRSDKTLLPAGAISGREIPKDYQIAHAATNIVGLHPNALASDVKFSTFTLHLPPGPDLSIGGNVAKVTQEHLGGTTPGYLTGRNALDQLADRYGLDAKKLEEIGFDPTTRDHFDEPKLREIERKLGLEQKISRL